MRLAPRSLFSRLVLVQSSVLIVALLVSFAIHMHERGEALSQASGMQAAQRITDIVKLLEPLSPPERRRIVQVLARIAERVAWLFREAEFEQIKRKD